MSTRYDPFRVAGEHPSGVGCGEGSQTVACGPEMGAVCRQRMFGLEGHL